MDTSLREPSISRILLIESVYDDLSAPRRKLIENSPRLSRYSISFCYLFKDEEEINGWLSKIERRAYDVPASMFRAGRVWVWEVLKGSGWNSLTEMFTDRIRTSIADCRPDAMIVHVGWAFMEFPNIMLEAFMRVKQRHPEIPIGLDKFGFKIADDYWYLWGRHGVPLRMVDCRVMPFEIFGPVREIARLIHDEVVWEEIAS